MLKENIPLGYHISKGTDSVFYILNDGDTFVKNLSKDLETAKIEAKKIVGNEASIIGNISVNSLFSDNLSEIITKSRKALADGVDILAPGCNLIPTTSVGNLRALTKAALEL